MQWMLLILVFRIEGGDLHSIMDRQVQLFQTEEQCVSAGRALQASMGYSDPKVHSVSTCVAREEFDGEVMAQVKG